MKGRLAVIISGSLLFKALRAPGLAAAACFAFTLPAFPQEKPAPPETPAPANTAISANPANPAAFAYDVVSIKPYKRDDGPISMGTYPSPDGFTAQATTLMSLLFQAYPILTLDQLDGLPRWGLSDFYNVEAKMDEETAATLKKMPRDQQDEIRRTMLQAVLADRFKLKAHKETRELPIYNLVIAKNGPKFKATPAGKEDKWHTEWAQITGDGIDFDQIPRLLAGEARRPIVDKTGLTGKYSFTLKWNPLEGQDSPAWFADQYPDFKGRPDLFIALEQQLGLKLESAKGPVDVYVIDHVEQPSPN